jgi:hypothetical protein
MWNERVDVAMESAGQGELWLAGVRSISTVESGTFNESIDASATESHGEWQDVDRELRSIARRQSGLDADLMRALREAERVRLWKHIGCVSMREYLERVFGYSPRVAQERLRTARKLEQLPELAAALADHELPFSAVRELTRVAMPATERAWRAAARGKCLREIEDLVSGLTEGDLPGSRKKPELMRGRISYEEIDTTTKALERQVRKALDDERSEHLDDNSFLSAVFELALGALAVDAGPRDRAKFQIVHYRCDDCGSTAQLGAGARIPIDEAHAERAECDAEHVFLDADAAPARAIPRKVRRFVELRDGGRCRIPGCRSSRNLELHHIEHFEDGGTHDPENLITTCGGHHDAHHDGKLWISGTSSALIVRRLDDPIEEASLPSKKPPLLPAAVNHPSSVQTASDAFIPSSPDETLREQRRAMIRDALTSLGWKKSAACTTADTVLAELGADAPPEALVRRALQLCRG